MSQSVPHVEDLLLDFAYGELSADDAAKVQGHLDGCAHCRGQWEEIQGVRKVMGAAPQDPAPQAGLESLLAYAEQAARRAQAGPPPQNTWWRRLMMPLASVTAVALIGVVAHEVYERSGTVEEMRQEVALAKLEKAAPAAVAASPRAQDPLEGQRGFATNAMAETLPPEEKPQQALKDHAPMEPSAPAVRMKSGAGRGLGALAEGAGAGAGFDADVDTVARQMPVLAEKKMAQGGGGMKGKASSEEAAAPPPPAAPAKVAARGSASAGPAGNAAPKAAAPTPDVVQQQAAAKAESDAAAKERKQELEEAYGTRAPSPTAPRREPLPAPTPAPATAPTSPRPADDAGDALFASEAAEAEVMDDGASLSNSGSRRDARKRRARAEAEAQAKLDAEEKASRAQALSDAARQAYADSDREQEARLLRQAVPLAGQDRPLLSGILVRLCDAEYALGRTQAGDAACDRVMQEFKGSAAARIALRQKQAHYAALGGQTGSGASRNQRAPAESLPAAVDRAQ